MLQEMTGAGVLIARHVMPVPNTPTRPLNYRYPIMGCSRIGVATWRETEGKGFALVRYFCVNPILSCRLFYRVIRTIIQAYRLGGRRQHWAGSMDPDIKWGSDMDPSASILSKSAPCDIRLSVDVDAAAAVAMEVGHTLRMQILDSVVPLL